MWLQAREEASRRLFNARGRRSREKEPALGCFNSGRTREQRRDGRSNPTVFHRENEGWATQRLHTIRGASFAGPGFVKTAPRRGNCLLQGRTAHVCLSAATLRRPASGCPARGRLAARSRCHERPERAKPLAPTRQQREEQITLVLRDDDVQGVYALDDMVAHYGDRLDREVRA